MSNLISQLIPLAIVLAVAGVSVFVGFKIYAVVQDIQGRVSSRLGQQNVVVSRTGVRVGVRHVNNEDYVGATQSYLVKAWNLSAEEKANEARLAAQHKRRHLSSRSSSSRSESQSQPQPPTPASAVSAKDQWLS